MKKFMRLTGSAVVFSLALVVGGCSFDGSPVIAEDILTTVDDSSELSVRVKRALRNSPQTASLLVNVTTLSDDTVKISGFLSNKETMFEVERVAGQVQGVRHVVNNMVVN